MKADYHCLNTWTAEAIGLPLCLSKEPVSGREVVKEMIRSDEVWFVEKDKDVASKLVSQEDDTLFAIMGRLERW